MNQLSSEHLDTQTLDQYCAAIGAVVLLKSVVIFENKGPEYVSTIQQAMDNNDKGTLLSEAHKLKGAAGSIGLKRIQEISQKLQAGDEPEWATLHPTWLAELQSVLDEDVSCLKQYLSVRA